MSCEKHRWDLEHHSVCIDCGAKPPEPKATGGVGVEVDGLGELRLEVSPQRRLWVTRNEARELLAQLRRVLEPEGRCVVCRSAPIENCRLCAGEV